MELFSEIYGCYFTVVSRILEQAQDGLTRSRLEQLVADNGFQDSTFHLLPCLFSGEWDMLERKGDMFYSKMGAVTKARWDNRTLKRISRVNIL